MSELCVMVGGRHKCLAVSLKPRDIEWGGSERERGWAVRVWGGGV